MCCQNTGIPGEIGGYTVERLLRAPCDGIFHPILAIGDIVKAGQTVAMVDDQPVTAQIDGIVRGLLQDNVPVKAGMKSGDIDRVAAMNIALPYLTRQERSEAECWKRFCTLDCKTDKKGLLL